MNGRRVLVLLLFALAACGISTGTGGSGLDPCSVQAPTECTTPTLRYPDVAPIINRRCVVCHSGRSTEWPLNAYQHVLDWRDDIRAMLVDCSMPPPDSDVRITFEEKTAILAWLRCGMPE
jgi:uncharacterized membrane protein